MRKHLAATIVLSAATVLSAAQTPLAVSAPAKTGIVSRTTKAMHYREPSNDTPEGRQQNRRVELVLSGDAIGSLTGIDSATTASTGQRQ